MTARITALLATGHLLLAISALPTGTREQQPDQVESLDCIDKTGTGKLVRSYRSPDEVNFDLDQLPQKIDNSLWLQTADKCYIPLPDPADQPAANDPGLEKRENPLKKILNGIVTSFKGKKAAPRPHGEPKAPEPKPNPEPPKPEPPKHEPPKPEPPQPGQHGTVINSVTGDSVHGNVVQGHTFGNVNIGDGTPPGFRPPVSGGRPGPKPPKPENPRPDDQPGGTVHNRIDGHSGGMSIQAGRVGRGGGPPPGYRPLEEGAEIPPGTNVIQINGQTFIPE